MNYFLKFSLLFIILFSVQSCMEFDVNDETDQPEVVLTEFFEIDTVKYYLQRNETSPSATLTLRTDESDSTKMNGIIDLLGKNTTTQEEVNFRTFLVFDKATGITGNYTPAVDSLDTVNTFSPFFTGYSYIQNPLNKEDETDGFGEIEMIDNGNDNYTMKFDLTFDNGNGKKGKANFTHNFKVN